MTGKSYNDGLTASVSYGYNAGWPTSVSAGGVVEQNTSFDGLGRVTGSSQTVNGVAQPFSYSYNLADSLTSIALPTGRVVSTGYDGAGRVNLLQGASTAGTTNYASSFSYAPHGAMTGMALGNGLWTSAGFNSRLQTTSVSLGTSSGATNIWSLMNGFSGTQNNGNVAGQTVVTLMLENGADIHVIQEMPGHSKLTTTELYTRVSIHLLKQVYEATHPGANLKRVTAKAFDRGAAAELMAALEAEAGEEGL